MTVMDYQKLMGVKETVATGIPWIDQRIGLSKLDSAWNYLTACSSIDGCDRTESLEILQRTYLFAKFDKETTSRVC